MLFNSIAFGLFLPLVFLAYWFLFKSNRALQNGFLLLASYVFYGWWDWRFLSLIILSSATDFVLGQQVFKSERAQAKKWLTLSCRQFGHSLPPTGD